MKNQQSGQSLIEVIIALGVLMVLVVGFTNIVLTSLQNATYARNQEIANQFARNAMEVVRVIRDQSTPIDGSPDISWNEIWSRSNYPIAATGNCYQISNENFPDYALSAVNCGSAQQAISNTIFTREIRFLDSGGATREYITVRVTIQWYESEGPRTVELSTNIAKLF